jgi:membrane fusion protein, copper/silver efflux system
MNRTLTFGVAALTLAALGAGYWLGARPTAHGQSDAGISQSAMSTSAKAERKILYYRNPMGLPDTSPVPKKDPMGMDYIPVFDGEEPAGSATEVKISTEKVQKLGVRIESAAMRVLDRQLRAAGRVEADERKTFSISPKFEGYVEKLHVNVTGQAVTRGQPLFEVYSPELVSAQREYAIAAQGVQALQNGNEETRRGMQSLADASLARLKNWDISQEQIKSGQSAGKSPHPDFPLPGVGHRLREEGHPGHALRAG